MDRIVYHLVHKNTDDLWHLQRSDDGECGVFGAKAEGIEKGRFLCRAHLAHGEGAQLVVHRGDGSFETEYTYGVDPARSPG